MSLSRCALARPAPRPPAPHTLPRQATTAPLVGAHSSSIFRRVAVAGLSPCADFNSALGILRTHSVALGSRRHIHRHSPLLARVLAAARPGIRTRPGHVGFERGPGPPRPCPPPRANPPPSS